MMTCPGASMAHVPSHQLLHARGRHSQGQRMFMRACKRQSREELMRLVIHRHHRACPIKDQRHGANRVSGRDVEGASGEYAAVFGGRDGGWPGGVGATRCLDRHLQPVRSDGADDRIGLRVWKQLGRDLPTIVLPAYAHCNHRVRCHALRQRRAVGRERCPSRCRVLPGQGHRREHRPTIWTAVLVEPRGRAEGGAGFPKIVVHRRIEMHLRLDPQDARRSREVTSGVEIMIAHGKRARGMAARLRHKVSLHGGQQGLALVGGEAIDRCLQVQEAGRGRMGDENTVVNRPVQGTGIGTGDGDTERTGQCWEWRGGGSCCGLMRCRLQQR
jgi:hypothetical protein